MKRAWLSFLLVCTLILSLASARADGAGVLTEDELGAWLNALLLSTVQTQPMNAPVGEESLTEDGYAFLYASATLFYNKPVLDAQSVLNAVAVTDEALDMPRGIRLGASAEMLLTAYGWQNPTLAGDESFAPLYMLNELPDAAYWAWAQRSGDQIQSVQCAIHALASDNTYTDTGVLYTVTDDRISSIRIYGLSATVSLADVQNNLSAVDGVSAGAGIQQAAAGVKVQSAAEPFGQSDLQFGRMDYLTLTEKGAAILFGNPESEAWAQDDNGDWLHTLSYADATLVFGMDANKQNARLDSLTLTGAALVGPRGLNASLTLQDALMLFKCDGNGATDGTAAILYGDGQTPPYGTLERAGGDATLRYVATVAGAKDAGLRVALRLAFTDLKLTEIMLYTF